MTKKESTSARKPQHQAAGHVEGDRKGREQLRELGCDQLQGFYRSAAVLPSEIGDFVQKSAEVAQPVGPREPARVAGASGPSALKRVRPRQRNGFASVATVDMEIGIQR
jgi:hypothetical protein